MFESAICRLVLFELANFRIGYSRSYETYVLLFVCDAGHCTDK